MVICSKHTIYRQYSSEALGAALHVASGGWPIIRKTGFSKGSLENKGACFRHGTN